jgi:alanine racemase
LLSPTVAEVDLSAIRDNIRAIRARVGLHVRIMPAVKADGYGHGAVQTSLACLDGGADALCVANVEEAIALRDAGVSVPILILGCSTRAAVEPILEHEITAAICDMGSAEALSDAAVRKGTQTPVHIKVDTGMGRIGVPAESAIEFARAVGGLPGLRIEGVFTHFPSSDEADPSFTLSQISAFKKVLGGLKRHGIRVPTAHASNSGGVLAFPQADFDAVRPGIMIYGSYPSSVVRRSIPLRQAMTLKTRIVFLKEAESGTSVSYGRTHTLRRRSKVATIPIGYADGYLRAFSNRGEAAVGGVRVPIIGRVCMDQCLVDVTDVCNVAVGDEVILYGGGYDFLDLTYVAERIGTISDELVAAVSKRVPRVYIN